MTQPAKSFQIHELIPKALWLQHLALPKEQQDENELRLWAMFDEKLLETIDTIKAKFNYGSMTINNYKWGGNREWSGLRDSSSSYYSKTSQHSLGKAVDCVFSRYTTDEVREYILNNPDEFPYVGGVELETSWLHIDVRPRVNGKIFTFKPKYRDYKPRPSK